MEDVVGAGRERNAGCRRRHWPSSHHFSSTPVDRPTAQIIRTALSTLSRVKALLGLKASRLTSRSHWPGASLLRTSPATSAALVRPTANTDACSAPQNRQFTLRLHTVHELAAPPRRPVIASSGVGSPSHTALRAPSPSTATLTVSRLPSPSRATTGPRRRPGPTRGAVHAPLRPPSAVAHSDSSSLHGGLHTRPPSYPIVPSDVDANELLSPLPAHIAPSGTLL